MRDVDADRFIVAALVLGYFAPRGLHSEVPARHPVCTFVDSSARHARAAERVNSCPCIHWCLHHHSLCCACEVHPCVAVSVAKRARRLLARVCHGVRRVSGFPQAMLPDPRGVLAKGVRVQTS